MNRTKTSSNKVIERCHWLRTYTLAASVLSKEDSKFESVIVWKFESVIVWFYKHLILAF